MANVVLVGTQWGDEGKGKIVDILAERADYIVRYQGGNNAGHTVVVEGREYIFHVVPSGVLHPQKVCVIGNGVVVDPGELLGEIDALNGQGLKVTGDNLRVSDQAHVILPYHKVLDQLREKKKTALRIGTTGRGIGPCYADKTNRCGIRIGDLLRSDVLAPKLRLNLAEKNEVLKNVYGFQEFSFDEIFSAYSGYGKRLAKHICHCSRLLNQALKEGKSILFEGAQGTLLDIDHGTYPYVTSSSATAGGACIGSGVGPNRIDRVIGVAKAYTTRVGEGPLPTEFPPPLMSEIRLKGKEFGATTGRPRRCGWFDAVVVRHSIAVNGVDELAVTKLDVFDETKTIKICTGYRRGTELVVDFPSDLETLSGCVPVYEEYPGWLADTTAVRRRRDLPANARGYLERLSELLEVPITMISIGSERSQILWQ